ncbi:MAG: aspartate dehydrogenase [Dorea sp.]
MKKKSFDRENLRPVIRSSICTGEKVAGFKDIHTGKFNDVMLIRNNRDMEEFLETYDIKEGEVSTEY